MFRTTHFSMLRLAAAVSIGGLLLVACGKSSTSPTPDPVAAADVNVPVAASTVALLFGDTLTFDSGIPALGTTAASTLMFSANPEDSATPMFSLTSGSDTISGTVAFGSCLFIISVSTNPPPNVGDTVAVDPCNLAVQTSGATVGVTTPVNVSVQLGSTTAPLTPRNVVITPSGNLNVNTKDGNIIATAIEVPTVVPTGPSN